VQSVPGPAQSPQVFETSSPLTATIANNAIPAAISQPWTLIGSDTSTWIAGTSNNIKIGDALLFISAPNGIPSTSGPAAVVYVTSMTIDSVGGNTLISWNHALPAGVTSKGSAVSLYIFRTKAALYGANAPVPGMFATTTLTNIPPLNTPVNSDWPFQYASNSLTINLDNSYSGLNPAASGASAPANQSQWMILTGPKYTSFFQIKSASESNPGLYSLSAKTTQLVLAAGTVLIGDPNLAFDDLIKEFVEETRTTTAYVQSELLPFANLPVTDWPLSAAYPLADGMLAPVSGSNVVLAGLQPIADNAPIGLSGKRVRIAPLIPLTGTGFGISNPNGGFTPAGAAGALAASPNQAFLVDAFPPVPDPNISGNLLWKAITVTQQQGPPTPAPQAGAQTVTGQPGTLSVPDSAGSFQLLPSVAADPFAAEATVVASSTVNGATTVLSLTGALERIYDTATVTVNANAVEATHGETVMEILGSGDATNAALQFQLKQSPLTYTAAATAAGSQSTLQVRVNNLLWTEVPNFLSSAPSNRVYATRPNSGAGPTVQFGDGIQGSRTPSGTSNIQALYRKGIGVAGMVAAGQLTQPLDRPQGLQNVTNPSPATGGADPATPASARQSAPLPTLTLGRIVSLEDYQNFALGFAGISLALATWTWFGNRRGVFLTIAGEGGTILSSTDKVVIYLIQAYQNFGLPSVQVMPVSYVPQNFEIGMQVKVNSPTYDPNQVIAQVWLNLSAAFAFGQLAPGQSVAASQVIEIAQQVPGVVAVTLTAFNLSGATSGVANILCAAGPIPPDISGSNPPTGAQILLLDPASQGNVMVSP